MTGALPCSKALFDAETADEFARQAAAEPTSRRPASLAEFAQRLSQDRWHGAGNLAFQGITVVHLLMAAHAVHKSCYALRKRQGYGRPLDRVALMADRWKALWDRVKGEDKGEKDQYIAFPGHADEVWCVTKAIVRVLKQKEAADGYALGVETDSEEDLHRFIRVHTRA
ncbi:putative transcription factor fungi protein [Neofusicoccum parvum UCRNP2]|uniref:Putative transcription factor fungi protein n=1 Tax=Botryosphaeria parva (strain UCR-NP2) TaxID=1287680 RepID=R1ETH2_BOTPV|nr:putative transcription factor fungi protein [Neofusicoccum parvum UCRNP2]